MEISLHAAISGATRLNPAWAALWCRTPGCPGEPCYAEAAERVAKGENILLWRPSGEGQVSENQWGALEFQACPHLLALARQKGWVPEIYDPSEGGYENDFFEFCEEHRGNFTLEVEIPEDLLELLKEAQVVQNSAPR